MKVCKNKNKVILEALGYTGHIINAKKHLLRSMKTCNTCLVFSVWGVDTQPFYNKVWFPILSMMYKICQLSVMLDEMKHS